jgi:hypothetical protein
MTKETTEALLKALKPVLKDTPHARRIMERFWSDKVAIVWSYLSVNRAANERGLKLTKAEAVKVLNDLFYHHDAQEGLQWEHLLNYIEDKVLGRPMTKEEERRFVEKDVVAIDADS